MYTMHNSEGRKFFLNHIRVEVAHMRHLHLVIHALHESGEVMVHVVEHHINAALHVVDLVDCRQCIDN